MGLDEARVLRLLAERLADLADTALEHLFADVGLGPHGVQELLLGHHPPGVLRQVAQHGEVLRPQEDLLRPPEQALVSCVETEFTRFELGFDQRRCDCHRCIHLS